MKVYGAHICPDCRNFQNVIKTRNLKVDYIDITESTYNLKCFLAYRDKEKIFDSIKEKGSIGIPFFVSEDGQMTLNPDEALSWINEAPIQSEELLEQCSDGYCSF